MARESFRPSPADRVKLQVVETDDSPVLVDLDGKDAPVIKIVDNTPEDQRGTTRDPAKWDDQNATDPKDVPERVQKRFDRLKAENATENRMRLESERQRDEAIRVARAREDEVNDLRQRLATNTSSLASSMTAERDTQIADATRRLEQAHAEGNSSAIAKATADLTRASAEKVAIVANTPRTPAAREERPPEQQRQQPAPQQQQLHPDVSAWIARNDGWWGKDKGRTQAAAAIDNMLSAKGIHPGDSRYIPEVDKRMKAEYSDHQPFSSSSDDGDDRDRTTSPRRTNAVAPGSRDTRPSGGPRTVELTATEFAVAKQLGLNTPEKLARYAAEKQRREQNGKGAQ